MSKDQYEIGQINCTQLPRGAGDWMGCFLGLACHVFFIGGGYGCCL